LESVLKKREFLKIADVSLFFSTYTVYIPKLIRPGFDVSITASILSAPNTVVVTARLLSTDNATALQASSTINPGKSTFVLKYYQIIRKWFPG